MLTYNSSEVSPTILTCTVLSLCRQFFCQSKEAILGFIWTSQVLYFVLWISSKFQRVQYQKMYKVGQIWNTLIWWLSFGVWPNPRTRLNPGQWEDWGVYIYTYFHKKEDISRSRIPLFKLPKKFIFSLKLLKPLSFSLTCIFIPNGSNKCTPTTSNLWEPNHCSQHWWWWNKRDYPRNYP